MELMKLLYLLKWFKLHYRLSIRETQALLLVKSYNMLKMVMVGMEGFYHRL